MPVLKLLQSESNSSGYKLETTRNNGVLRGIPAAVTLSTTNSTTAYLFCPRIFQSYGRVFTVSLCAQRCAGGDVLTFTVKNFAHMTFV